MTITPITDGESGVSVRTSLNEAIAVINGDAAASNVVGVPLTTGITGTLLPAHGGTGTVTNTAHGVLMGAGISAVAASAAGTAGQVFQSGGASADGAYAALNLATAASLTGVLPLARLLTTRPHEPRGTLSMALATWPVGGEVVQLGVGQRGELVVGTILGRLLGAD